MKFEIKRSRRNQQYRAYILGNNGEKVFTSEQYTTCANAVKAIKIINKQLPKDLPIDVFDENGNWSRTIQPEREDVYI